MVVIIRIGGSVTSTKTYINLFIFSTEISAVFPFAFDRMKFFWTVSVDEVQLKKNTLKLKEACTQWVSLWHSAHAVRKINYH